MSTLFPRIIFCIRWLGSAWVWILAILRTKKKRQGKEPRIQGSKERRVKYCKHQRGTKDKKMNRGWTQETETKTDKQAGRRVENKTQRTISRDRGSRKYKTHEHCQYYRRTNSWRSWSCLHLWRHRPKQSRVPPGNTPSWLRETSPAPPYPRSDSEFACHEYRAFGPVVADRGRVGGWVCGWHKKVKRKGKSEREGENEGVGEK